MKERIMICTDLDRTLIPNGTEPESPGAMDLFRKIVEVTGATLVYVTGRHVESVMNAVKTFDLPFPHFVIADVGTSLYDMAGGVPVRMKRWDEIISADWKHVSRDEITGLIKSYIECTLQEEVKQGVFKLSFYVPSENKMNEMSAKLEKEMEDRTMKSHLIKSYDKVLNMGLLDVIPVSADKKSAVEFLMEYQNVSPDHLIFSGDSGNDMSVFVSPLQSVVVANADLSVKKQATEGVEHAGYPESLYVAKGGSGKMNGNYVSGIIEGIFHYFPYVKAMLENK